MQIHNQRQRTGWGTGIKPKMDVKHTWYMFKKDSIQNNRDSYKESTKIPPPHPHNRNFLNFSFTQRIHIVTENCQL